MTRLSVQCYEPTQAHKAMTTTIWPQLKAMLIAGHRMVLEVKPETRSLASNRVMWARLNDIASLVPWWGKTLTAEDYKHLLTSSLKKFDVVPNLDGSGFVALGLHTSNMTRAEMEEIKELCLAFGTERGVKWSVASLCGEPE